MDDRDYTPSNSATALAEPPAPQERVPSSAGSMIVFETVTKVYDPDVVALNEVGNAQGVLDGDLDGFIRAYLLRTAGNGS